MIGEIISNSAINAKIHAKMKNNLKAEDFERIVHMHSVAEIAEMLKNTPKFRTVLRGLDVDKLHRGELEALLQGLVARDIRSILSFSGTSVKFFLSIFAIRSEIEYIKVLLRRLNSNETYDLGPVIKFESEFHSGVDFVALSKAKGFDEFTAVLQHTAYYLPFKGFSGTGTPPGNFEIEAALDKFYRKLTYAYMSRFLSKADAKAVRRIFDIDTDIENIMFIIRAKLYYKMDKEMINLYMSDKGRRLKPENIRDIINADSNEELKNAIGRTVYRGIFGDGLEKTEGRIAEARLMRHRRAFRQNPYCIEAVLYYIEMQEMEIRNITMAVEGVRYGLDPDIIKSYLLGMTKFKV